MLLLVVEDDPDIQYLLNIALTDAEFEVITACDAEQAMDKLNWEAARFRAVITSIRLGTGPDGWDVGRHSREIVSDMAVVYITGGSGHAWASKGVPGSVLVFKPFALAQLITAVSTLLIKADARRAVGGGDG